MKTLGFFSMLAFLSAIVGPASAAGSHAKGAAPAHIARGETIQLADYLVTGKTTVFDFMSEYCPPCRGYVKPLAALHAKRADLAVVEVDINRPDVRGIDWHSPVATQFGLESIPHFVVYGPDGKLLAEDNGEDSPARDMVDKWLAALHD